MMKNGTKKSIYWTTLEKTGKRLNTVSLVDIVDTVDIVENWDSFTC